MKMIETMTKTQEKKVPVYLKKWMKVGLRTKAIDRKKAKKAVHLLYEIAGAEKPKYVVFLDSPMMCQLAINLIEGTKLESNQLDSQLVDSKLDSQFGSELDSKLDSELHSQLGSQLHSKLRSELHSQLHSQLHSKLRSELHSKLRSELGSEKLQYFSYDYCATLWGWANYYGFYDFVLNELFPEKKKDFKLFYKFTEAMKEYHQTYMFDSICFVSDFPKEINRNADGDLHHFDKAALVYRDGWGLYMSNGIQMKEEYITTPKDEITREMYLNEENADMKAEMLKKVGLDRMLEALNPKVIDTMKTKHGGSYRLLNIAFTTGQSHNFLQMKCPSTKKDHILGVENGFTKAEQGWLQLNIETDYKKVNVIWEA